MIAAPIPENEEVRLRNLVDYRVLDSQCEASFDKISWLAADLFDVPTAQITFVDQYRLWVKSSFGSEFKGCDRDLAFCSHAIQRKTTMAIEDARLDNRLVNNPFVTSDNPLFF